LEPPGGGSPQARSGLSGSLRSIDGWFGSLSWLVSSPVRLMHQLKATQEAGHRPANLTWPSALVLQPAAKRWPFGSKTDLCSGLPRLLRPLQESGPTRTVATPAAQHRDHRCGLVTGGGRPAGGSGSIQLAQYDRRSPRASRPAPFPAAPVRRLAVDQESIRNRGGSISRSLDVLHRQGKRRPQPLAAQTAWVGG